MPFGLLFFIFLHNLHFFLHPFRRPKLSHRLGSWTCPLYFEGAAVHRRRSLRYEAPPAGAGRVDVGLVSLISLIS